MSPYNPWFYAVFKEGNGNCTQPSLLNIIPQQDNASFEYLFLVTICFYSRQSLTSYYVSIFIIQIAVLKGITILPSLSHSRSVLQGKRGIKMTDAPVPNDTATGAGRTQWWFKTSFWVTFWKSLIWNPPPEKEVEEWRVISYQVALNSQSLIRPSLKVHNFCSPGSQLGTRILARGSDSVWENSPCDPGEAVPGGITSSSFSAASPTPMTFDPRFVFVNQLQCDPPAVPCEGLDCISPAF